MRPQCSVAKAFGLSADQSAYVTGSPDSQWEKFAEPILFSPKYKYSALFAANVSL
jgi:hypothetical protein